MMLGRAFRPTPGVGVPTLTVAAQFAALTAVSFVLVYLSMMAPSAHGQFAPIGASTAVILAALVLAPRRSWPAIAAAGLVGRVAASALMRSRPEVALALALCGMLEYLAAAALLLRVIGRRPDLARVSTICAFLGIVAVAAAVSAVPAALIYQVMTGSQAFAGNLLTWAARDFSGMATLTPCLIVLASQRRNWRQFAGLGVWPLGLLALVEAGVFLQQLVPLAFLIMPALMLVTWRLRIAGAVIGTLMTMAIAVPATLSGLGPFDMIAPPAERLLVLQLFLTICFYVSVPVAIQVTNAQRLREELGQALQRSVDAQALYQVMADNVSDVVVRTDRELRMEYVSPACRSLGWEPEELIGKPPEFLTHPDDLEGVRANIARYLAGETVSPWERRYRFRAKDGTYRWFEGNPVVLRDETGAPCGILNSFRDVDEQHVAEEALAASEIRHRVVAENMHDVVVQMDVDDRLIYVSPSCSVWGYTPQEMLGRRALEFIHREEKDGVIENRRQLLNVPQPTLRRRARIRMKDGSFRWHEGSPSRLTDAKGETVGIVSILRDVHDEQLAAEALAESEMRYRLVTENMNDLVACAGRDGRLTFVSGASEQMLGYTAAEMIGMDVGDSLVHPDDREAAAEHLRQCLRAGPAREPFRFEYRARRKDGAYVWVEASPRPIFGDDGHFVEFQDVIRDISAHKALQEGLQEARAAADAAANLKAEFLADLSHELRGPLHSVHGLARLAHKEPQLIEPVRGYLGRIADASRALLVLVNDVLEFSKLDAARVVFRPRPVRVSGFLRATLAQLEPQAKAKNLQIEYLGSGMADLVVSFDSDRVRQVVLNLLGNAVKFTRSGKISLQAVYDFGEERLTVTITDTGPGIPADRLEWLFKRFSQVGGRGEQGYAGAGLGLAISKRIVDGLGGEIGVASEFGQGSSFYFSIPAPVREAADTWEEEQAAAPRIRVLVADSDPGVGQIVAEALGKLNPEVLTAPDTDTALDLVGRVALDLILLEMSPPGRQAQAVLRRIRRSRGPNAMTPVLALTSPGVEGGAEPMSLDGFEGLAPKPLSRVELISAVAHALAAAPGGPLEQVAGPLRRAPPVRAAKKRPAKKTVSA